MCDHSQSTKPITETTKLEDEPTDAGKCHIYYVHQNGEIRCEPNVQFKDSKDSTQHVTSMNDPDKNKSEKFCGDDRLTLIHLPSKDFKSIYDNPDESQMTNTGPQATTEHGHELLSIPIPDYFMEKLKNICPYCHCKGDILWRNLQRAEPHFDACFRYFDGKTETTTGPANAASQASPTVPLSPAGPVTPEILATQVVPKGPAVPTELVEAVEHAGKTPHRRCFLKLYTLRVPFLARKTVALSLVHHVRAEGKIFVTPRKDSTNQEHIFGFIAGFTGPDLGQLLRDRVRRWQDISIDHSVKPTAGMTPRLFTAAVISQYGSIVAQEVMDSARTLVQSDQKLQSALRKLKDLEPGSSGDVTIEIGRMNETLIDMNINLTGTRSTMHYLAESAHTLVNGVSTFEKYIDARLSEWKENADAEALKTSLVQLDSCKELIRDNDKLELVRKTMQQYKVDIKALQQHIDINVGMVRNLIAERDKVIQNVIAGNTARDGFIMKIVTVLTAFFLPGTFVAIFLTGPMFDFKNTENVVVGFATMLYWSITGAITFLLILGQLLLAHPKWIITIFDWIDWDWLKKSRLYTESKKRSEEKETLTMERKSVVRRSESQLSENTQTTTGQNLSNGSAVKTTRPENQNVKLQNGGAQATPLRFGRATQPMPTGPALV